MHYCLSFDYACDSDCLNIGTCVAVASLIEFDETLRNINEGFEVSVDYYLMVYSVDCFVIVEYAGIDSNWNTFIINSFVYWQTLSVQPLSMNIKLIKIEMLKLQAILVLDKNHTPQHIIYLKIRKEIVITTK